MPVGPDLVVCSLYRFACFWMILWCLASCGAIATCLFDFVLVTRVVHDRRGQANIITSTQVCGEWEQCQLNLGFMQQVLVSDSHLDSLVGKADLERLVHG